MSTEISSSSLSKGVFVFKGKKLKANPKDYINTKRKSDQDADRPFRMELYENLWGRMSAKIKSLQSDQNTKVLEDLLDFVQRCHINFRFDFDPDDLQKRRVVLEIPTAAFVTGVNTPDHGAMFSNLTTTLRKRVTPHVATLRSVRCQTIQSIISETVSQLLNTSDSVNNEDYNSNDDDDDNGGVVVTGHPVVKKRMSRTMFSITRWYTALYKNRCESFSPLNEQPTSPRKRRSTANLPDVNFSSPSKKLKSPLSSPCKQLSGMSMMSPPRNSPAKTHKNDASKTSLLSPEKTGSTLSRTPQKSRSSCRKLILDDSPKPVGGASTKRDKDLPKSPPQPRRSPRKKLLDDSPGSLYGSPQKLAKPLLKTPQKLWSSPRKVLPESPESRAEFPKNPAAETPQKTKENEADSRGSRRRKAVNPIVIIVEDFEGFPHQVLQDFITICGHHLDELPLVLVFGIATTQNAVHRALPHAVSSILSMEKFQAPPSSEFLTQVLTQVLMTPDFPYKLSGRVFSFLLDIFLYHDFSVVGFVQAFKFSVLDHFYSNASSVLCQIDKSISQQVALLSSAQIDGVRSCVSFMRFVESHPPTEQIKLLEDNTYTKKVIKTMMEKVEDYHATFYPVLLCLHALVHKLPRLPLGKQLRELYASCLSGNIYDLPEYDHAISLIRSFAREELRNSLQELVRHLGTGKIPDQLTPVLDQLCLFCDKLDSVEELASAAESTSSSVVDEILPKKLDMFTLKQKLQGMDKKKKNLTYYEALRKEIVDHLDSTFRKYLLSPKNLVLHEVMYYDGLDLLRRSINTSPRSIMQKALVQPYSYLPNNALNLDHDQLTGDLPDICIVYKLHLECGRLINLYDWLQAFIMIVRSENVENHKQRGKSVDRILQARFIRAVSELQFLGFIKPTQRKTDHVARLTWGGC